MRTYLSKNGIYHKIIWIDNLMYLKCIRAVGYKTEKQIIKNANLVTCKNCLRGKI